MNQRNRLLKDCYMNPGLKGTLDVWDMQMVDYGKKIIGKREAFVEELNEIARGFIGPYRRDRGAGNPVRAKCDGGGV